MLVRTLSRIAIWLWLCGGLLAAGTSGVWLDVPFVRQEKNGCGAASMAMVMQYWLQQQGRVSDGADPALIQRALYSRQAQGIYASAIEQYLEQNGFHTFAFHGEWETLRHHLEKGRPLIVALRPSGSNAPLHYVVVTGLDWHKELVMVNDPAARKLLKQERSKFETEWKPTANWTLLAVPQQGGR
jgi:ABC-type bacteriocin/lantibiotic exporter with double-glycine peptidase domain